MMATPGPMHLQLSAPGSAGGSYLLLSNVEFIEGVREFGVARPDRAWRNCNQVRPRPSRGSGRATPCTCFQLSTTGQPQLIAGAPEISPAPRRSRRPTARHPLRSAFTLFELILAIALSVVLLALIGAAVNLYLLQVDAGRTRIEEAQLARSVLAMIADDVRNTSVYKPQDTSGVASLVAASSAFDVDSLDKQSPKSPSTPGSGLNSQNSSASGSGSGPSSGSGGAGAATGGGSSPGGGSSAGGSNENELTMPLGVNGTLEELYVDVEHLPRMDEIFLTNTGYTNTQPLAVPAGTLAAAPPRPNSVKTIRYFIRQGSQAEPGSAAATSLAGNAQLQFGGLVRQQVARPARLWAEQSGDQSVLESGQTLIAPEVVRVQFRYFDGQQILDYWDMKEKGMLPPAVEITIWIWAGGNDQMPLVPGDTAGLLAKSHEYRQIVFLPSAVVSAAGAAAMSAGAAGTSSNSTSSNSSSDTSSASGSGSNSSFDQ